MSMGEWGGVGCTGLDVRYILDMKTLARTGKLDLVALDSVKRSVTIMFWSMVVVVVVEGVVEWVVVSLVL